MSEEYVLNLKKISKSFPGVKALDEVSLRVRPGEVHALVGENGAGKSTLLKIMYGIEKFDSGKILINGQAVAPANPSQAQQLGISLVHQELQQIPELSVAQNMFLAREVTYPGGVFVNQRQSAKEAEAILKKIGMDIDVHLQVKLLSIADRQMVEIAKALLVQAQVIAFDEPTSSLTNVETEKLFKVIGNLKAEGVGIIYVSHRLEEIMEIADTVTVLRDGRLVGEAPIEAVDQATLVRMMIDKDNVQVSQTQGAFIEMPEPSRPYHLGILVKYLGNPYWQSLTSGMKSEADKYGLSLDIYAAQSETDRAGQLVIMEEMIERGYDALLISPQTDTNLKPAVEKAREAGILLINVNDAIIHETEHFVGPNQHESGVRVANYFIKMFPDGGKVAIIEGQPNVYATTQRTNGFKDTLPTSRFDIVASVSGQWDRHLAEEQAGVILDQYSDLLGIYCNNDTMALGAMQAVKNANKLGRVVVIGHDGISEAYESIRAGEITGTIDSFPEQTGQVSVRVAISLLEGQKKPRNVFTPQNLITLHNIDHPLANSYQEIKWISRPEEIRDQTDKKDVLHVNNLNTNKIKDVSFSLKEGEILGIAGLVGSGRSEMVRALYGANPATGEIYIRGRRVKIRTPEDAIREGIAFLPEDRKLSGLVRLLSMKINVTLASLPKMQRFGFLNFHEMAQSSSHYVKTLNIEPPYLDIPVSNLSGGNQQKVIIARWLITNSRILIFDEPTRGIDVGTKEEIHNLMNELAHQGKSIIMVSSELPEILRMSHRILVMREGRIVKEIPRSQADQEKIMHYAYGGK